jgi:hypothetical protein
MPRSGNGEGGVADVEADSEEEVVLAEVHVPFVGPDLREAGIEIEVGAAFGATQQIVVLERAAEIDEQGGIAEEGPHLMFFDTENFAVVIEHAQWSPRPNCSHCVRKTSTMSARERAAPFFGRAENVEPEDLEAERPQAGE